MTQWTSPYVARARTRALRAARSRTRALRFSLLLCPLLVACADKDVLPDTPEEETSNADSDPDSDPDSDQEEGVEDEDDASASDPSGGEEGESDASTPDAGDEAVDAAAASDAGTANAQLDASGDSGQSPSPEDAAAASDAGMDAADSAPVNDAQVVDANAPDASNFLTYYRDAKPIIDAKCKPCHYQGGIGPFPLTRYSEVRPYASLMEYDIDAGIMPPWRAAGPHGVYVGDRRLTPAQKSTLLTWIAQGNHEGDPATEPAAIPSDRRDLARVDLSLPIGGPYTQTLRPDDYRCFVMEWPYTNTRYVTGINIVPTRTQSVHHSILYLEPPENAASVRAQDRADSGPGFSCFSNIASLTTWLSSYEPGGYGQSVPEGLGFEVRPGSLMVLQVHYNAQNGVGPDNTRVDFSIADRVQRPATVHQLLDSSWVLGFMSIPANQSDVVYRWRGRPSGISSLFSSFDLHWVDLHMHTLGSRGSVSIIRSNGQRESLLSIPDWDFNWQQTYVFNRSLRLNPGDDLEVECHFDNTAANQMVVNGERLTPRSVNWGEGTTDEMCLGNVLATRAQ